MPEKLSASDPVVRTPDHPLFCSPRVAGLIYLAIIVLGLFGEAYVRASVVVGGDAVATSRQLGAAEGLWRAGVATDLLMHVLDVPLIVFFYLWLKPVSPTLALLATVLNIVQTCVLAGNKLWLLAALHLVLPSAGAGAAGGPDATARAELALMAVNLHSHGFAIGLIFFGLACVVRAVLIVRSGFAPRAIGVALGVGGACYIVNSLALLLAPALASMLFPAILFPAFVGEAALCVWLLLAKPAHMGRPGG